MTRHLTLETFTTVNTALARCSQLRRNGSGPLQIWPITYPGGYLVASFGDGPQPGQGLRLWLWFRGWCAQVTGYTHERWAADEDDRRQYY